MKSFEINPDKWNTPLRLRVLQLGYTNDYSKRSEKDAREGHARGG